jgi:signal transduction histidine kinase
VLLAQNPVIDSLKQAFKEAPKGEQRINILNTLSWEFKNSDLDSCMHYARLALAEAKGIPDENAIATAYNSIANAYEAMGIMDSTEYYHKASLRIKETLGDSLGVAATLNNLGILFDLTDRNQQSLRSYYRSLRLYEAYGEDPFQEAMVMVNIGIVLKKIKDYEQAVEYYQRANAIYEENGSDFGVTVTNGNIGGILINLGKYEESLAFSRKALEGYTSLGYTRYIPYMHHNMALAYDSMKAYKQAEAYYVKAIEKHESFENHIELSSCYNGLAYLYLKLGRFSDAERLAGQALSKAELVASAEFQLKATKTLALASLQNGKPKKAGQLFMSYIAGNDSLYEIDKNKALLELEKKYESEKKEQQIALQNAEIASQKAQNQKSNILIVALTVSILLIIALALLLINRTRLKNRNLLEEEKRKSREKEIHAVLSSQEKERNRFARDLHDGFGQLISSLNLNLQGLQTLKNKDIEERTRVFDSAKGILDNMYGEIKNICFDLMPQTLIKHGLSKGLEELVHRLNAPQKQYFDLNIFGLEQRLPEIQEISLYRIVQEWANNVMKYSEAQKITIQLTADEKEITLLIEDDGLGFDKAILTEGKGNGWRNMQSRAHLMGGELELDTKPGVKGNTLILNAVRIEVPNIIEKATNAG